MYICYVDESGNASPFDLTNPATQPFFVIVGLAVDQVNVIPLTRDFVVIKRRFFPHYFSNITHSINAITIEIKGTDIRRSIRAGTRREKTHAFGYIDACMLLLQRHDVKLYGRALVKQDGMTQDDESFYGRSVWHICEHFNAFCDTVNHQGLVIADGRDQAQNRRTGHSVFTHRYAQSGNNCPRLVEIPVFGTSNNFAMIQLADLICSAVVFPMVSDAFSAHLVCHRNDYVHAEYGVIRQKYKQDIKDMQYKYQNSQGHWVGGMVIADHTTLTRRSSLLFR